MAAVTASSANDAEFARLHHELLSDPSFQFHFDKPDAPPSPPDWLEPLARFIGFIAPYFVYIFWAGVIVVVGLIIYTIAIEIMRRLPDAKRASELTGELPIPEFRPSRQRAHVLLDEADRLAAEGRFAEAVRIILHRSIEDMETAFPGSISPAMTSREIQHVTYLSETGRTTFSRIASAVETSLFAGRPLDRQRFLECRTAYETFVAEASPA